MENSLDKGELEVFFENSKKICELTSVENLVIDKESTEIGLSVGYRQYDENVQQLTVDYIRNIVGPYISMNETKKKCDAFYEIPAVDYKDKCFLLDSFGISATTNNMDSAKEYLKYVLAYNDITYTGQEAFPIKKEACETLVDSYIETHSNENNLKASDTDAVAISSECKKLLTNFDEIENPIIVDDHIDAIFFAQLTQYLNGELSKSEAVNSVFEKIGIYISE